MPDKTPEVVTVSSRDELDGRRGLKIILWFICGALIFSVLCCVCTLGLGWFAGDWIIELLRTF